MISSSDDAIDDAISAFDIETYDGGGYVLVLATATSIDPDRREKWADTAFGMQAKHRKPVVLLVVSADESTARWAESPIPLGPAGQCSVTVQPFVLGPHNVPVITDPEEAARDISLAAFVAFAIHRNHPDVEAILEALATAMRTAGASNPKTAVVADTVTDGLADTPAADIWRALAPLTAQG